MRKNLPFFANTFSSFLSSVGEYSAPRYSVADWFLICTEALVIWWEQLLEYILHFNHTSSFL